MEGLGESTWGAVECYIALVLLRIVLYRCSARVMVHGVRANADRPLALLALLAPLAPGSGLQAGSGRKARAHGQGAQPETGLGCGEWVGVVLDSPCALQNPGAVQAPASFSLLQLRRALIGWRVCCDDGRNRRRRSLSTDDR